MQSIYTAGTSNYSMANLYKGAGVVNITSSYLPQNSSSYIVTKNGQQNWNGEILTGPTSVQTSVVLGSIKQVAVEQATNIEIKQTPEFSSITGNPQGSLTTI